MPAVGEQRVHVDVALARRPIVPYVTVGYAHPRDGADEDLRMTLITAIPEYRIGDGRHRCEASQGQAERGLIVGERTGTDIQLVSAGIDSAAALSSHVMDEQTVHKAGAL